MTRASTVSCASQERTLGARPQAIGASTHRVPPASPTETGAHARSSASSTTQARTLVDVTRLTDADRAFVLRTWRTEGVVDNIDRVTRLRVMALVSETLVDAPSMTVLVARPLGDALTILGWLARDGSGRVHAIYVKPAVRNIGVASALMRAGACKRVLAYPLSVRGIPRHSWRHEPWYGWAAAIEAKAGDKQ